MDGPHNARFLSASEKKFSDLIVFVHHFGGHRGSAYPHQKFVAELGFDSVAFDLLYHDRKRTPLKPQSMIDAIEGFRHKWARQITDVLDAWEGPKVIYSFSMPSSAAAEAIASRQAKDISGWICEGGPFLQNIRCFWNYFSKAQPVKNRILRAAYTATTLAMIGNYKLPRDLKKNLSEFPNRFPVLSIRAWQDQLVPISAIDEVFTEHSHLNLQILSLPESLHIQGLSHAPNEYKPRVQKFLTEIAKNHPLGASHKPKAKPTKKMEYL